MVASRGSHLTYLFGTLCVLNCVPARLEAAPATVTFDVAGLVECHDVTTIEFARVHPRERLLEARLPISTLITGDDAHELTELFYRVDSPEGTVRFVDYFPKTTLTSEYAGNVGIEEKQEQHSNAGLNATGAYGPISATTATLSAGDKTANCRRYELLPPLEAVAASGTVDRENGVYFKLRATNRTSVEGSQEVVVILCVPSNWRADYVMVRCQAFGKQRQLPFMPYETQLRGQGNFVVGLYSSGDEAAQATAAAFLHTESHLRRVAAKHREEIERRSAPTAVHELAVHLSVKQPRIPESWLEQVLAGRERETTKFMGYLPAPVRESAMDYFAVRRRLRGMNAAGVRLPRIESTAGKGQFSRVQGQGLE